MCLGQVLMLARYLTPIGLLRHAGRQFRLCPLGVVLSVLPPKQRGGQMYSRGEDLYQLKKDRAKAKNAFERKICDRALERIKRENSKIEGLRQNLIKAVRGNSQRAINYYTNEINKIRIRENG